jgi:exopolyphosphatase/guanosine-5'-triphosphate,3'-diphosphate pyrophosphatase
MARPTALAQPSAEAARHEAAAVVDIGSNSLRLVVYDGVRRAARTLINEKVLCGLGRGLGSTGRLNADGVAQAFENLRRFVELARAVGARRLDLLATAAVREAADGKDFAAEIERRFGVRVRVLSGPEEGRLSALGVLSGIPGANGIVGDLGGGSVELVPVAKGEAQAAATLPLGPLRLADLAGDDKRLREAIDTHLATVPWLADAPKDAFYAVGGAWRALARIHMEQTRYPLHIIQQYALPRAEAEKFLDIVARQSRKSLEKITTVSKKRLDVVPLAARMLARLLRRIEARHLVFSATGLREGHLYALLGPAEQRADPLIAACLDTARADPRFDGGGSDRLFAWADPLFPGETAARRRLRRAAALLGDVAWHEHPDYRAEQALRHALFMPVTGVDHGERVFLAAALHARYGGGMASEPHPAFKLLDEEALAAARLVGLALRLGYTLSGGVPALLAGSGLALTDAALVLTLSAESAGRFGESVQRRLDALARALGRRAEVRRP